MCGKWPCICPTKPCPICGNLPCTCPKDIIEIEIGKGRKAKIKKDFNWEERIMFDGKLITLQEFVNVLVDNDTLPKFFKDDEDLRTQWQNPDTRKALLEKMEHDGFSLDKLLKVNDAKVELGSLGEINKVFVGFQKGLYAA